MPTNLAPTTWLDLSHHAEHPSVRAWQAHLDAGRIGHRIPAAPAIAANRARTEALFAAHARREARA